jgi:hypothetical protein
MRETIRWVLLRTALYMFIAVVGITGVGFAYSAATGTGIIAGSGRSLSNLNGWLHIGVGVAILGGGLTLILLGILAPFRKRLPNVIIKLILLPFFLLPVLLIDLVGADPPAILGLLGIQVLYLIVVRMNKLRA